MKLIELLCARLRWTSDQVEEVILQNLPGRLASALLRLTEKHKLAAWEAEPSPLLSRKSAKW